MFRIESEQYLIVLQQGISKIDISFIFIEVKIRSIIFLFNFIFHIELGYRDEIVNSSENISF